MADSVIVAITPIFLTERQQKQLRKKKIRPITTISLIFVIKRAFFISFFL